MSNLGRHNELYQAHLLRAWYAYLSVGVAEMNWFYSRNKVGYSSPIANTSLEDVIEGVNVALVNDDTRDCHGRLLRSLFGLTKYWEAPAPGNST